MCRTSVGGHVSRICCRITTHEPRIRHPAVGTAAPATHGLAVTGRRRLAFVLPNGASTERMTRSGGAVRAGPDLPSTEADLTVEVSHVHTNAAPETAPALPPRLPPVRAPDQCRVGRALARVPLLRQIRPSEHEHWRLDRDVTRARHGQATSMPVRHAQLETEADRGQRAVSGLCSLRW
jgi:hypothetical protein